MQYIFSILDVNALPTCNAKNANVHYLEPVWPTKNDHSISVTQFSSLITHHSSLIFSHSFGNITFIFITQFFHTIHGSHTCQSVQCFFFSFLFFSFPGLALAVCVFFSFLFFSFPGLAVQFFFLIIILASVSWVLKKKKKKLYLLAGVGPMNSVKKLSNENKSDVAKWVWKNEWWVMSDEWWKLSDGNWVMIFCCPNRLLVSRSHLLVYFWLRNKLILQWKSGKVW